MKASGRRAQFTILTVFLRVQAMQENVYIFMSFKNYRYHKNVFNICLLLDIEQF